MPPTGQAGSGTGARTTVHFTDTQLQQRYEQLRNQTMEFCRQLGDVNGQQGRQQVIGASLEMQNLWGNAGIEAYSNIAS